MALIKFKNAEFSYNGITVLKGLNFEINKGDFLCIVGSNGSGKTTLVNGILGNVKLSSGEMHITFNKNSTGYLPQITGEKKEFPVSVKEVVLSGCGGKHKFFSFYSKCDNIIANENANLLNITDLFSKPFNQLSGGQQQRVLIARALCAAKELLIIDEPVTGLDNNSTEVIYESLNTRNRKDNLTVVMVTHDNSAVLKIATHILLVDNEQLFFGTKDEYIKYLGGDKNEPFNN